MMLRIPRPALAALVTALAALAGLPGCVGEHRPARDRYNEGVAALAKGEYDAAEKALIDARSQAGVDPELRFRAAYDLGVALAAHADKLRIGKDADLGKALELAQQAASWFNDADRLRPGDAETRANLAIVRARVQAISDELRKGEGKLEARLDRLIGEQRSVLDQAREAWLAIKQAGGSDPLAQQSALTHLADTERGIVAEAGVVGDLAADEIDAIGKKPEDKRDDEEKARIVQLKNLDLYLMEGRSRIAEARRKLQELAAEDGVSRAEAALVALKRAREQLLDPITVLQRIAQDELSVLTDTAQSDGAALALGNAQAPGKPAAPASVPGWLEPLVIAGRQSAIRDRLEEVRARLSAAVEADAHAASAPAASTGAPASAPASTSSPGGSVQQLTPAKPPAGQAPAQPSSGGHVQQLTPAQPPAGQNPQPAAPPSSGGHVQQLTPAQPSSGHVQQLTPQASAAPGAPGGATAPGAASAPPGAAGAPPQDPKQAKLLARVRAALPSVVDASTAMDRAHQALVQHQIKQAIDDESAAIEALNRAIEQFADLKHVVELAYREHQALLQLLGPEAAKQLDAQARGKQTRELLVHNLDRMPRLKELLTDEAAQVEDQARALAARAEPDAQAAKDPKQAEAAKQQIEQQKQQLEQARQQMAHAEELRTQAASALAALDKALSGRGDPMPPAKDADTKLSELRKLFFSVIEHLQELIREQGETRDQTSAASGEDDFTRAPKLPGLVTRQDGHAEMAKAITEALAHQADAAGKQPAQPQQGPDAKALSAAADEVRQAQGDMAEVHATLVKARDSKTTSESLAPGVKSQGKAIEHLENALKLLQPPSKGNQDKNQQQQQQQQQQKQQKQDQQPQQGGAGQRARDQDAKRQRDRADRDAQNDPVEKDW